MSDVNNQDDAMIIADKHVSDEPPFMRALFQVWLLSGKTRKYEPDIILSRIDKVSEYAVKKEISSSFWDITHYSVFKPVYDRIISIPKFREKHKKAYKEFVAAGWLYLEFLRERLTSNIDKDEIKQPEVKIEQAPTLSKGVESYSVSIENEIDTIETEVRNNIKTTKLIQDGELYNIGGNLTQLLEADSISSVIIPVSLDDFHNTIDSEKENILERVKNKGFCAIIAFALDDEEASKLREVLKNTIIDKQFEKFIFIDALSMPLGNEGIAQYVHNTASSILSN